MDDLFYLVAIHHNTDNIKPDNRILRIALYKNSGGTFEKRLLFTGYGLLREAKIQACAGLDFHDHQHILFVSYDIYLLFAASPVIMQNNIPFI